MGRRSRRPRGEDAVGPDPGTDPQGTEPVPEMEFARSAPASEPPGPAPFRRPRVRGRLLAIAALAAVVAAAGAGLQRVVGVRPAAAGSPGPSTSGAWFCPHGGGDGWRAWVVIANPGEDAVPIRITTFGARGVKATSSEVVPGSTQVYRAISASGKGTATEIEYFGHWVGAGWVVQRIGSDAFLGASRCADSPSGSWYLPDLPTARGQSAFIELMNPFGADAAVNVAIQTDRRSAVRPGSLSPFIVPARTSTEIRLNQFLLQAPDEKIVAAEARVELGRVVVAAVDLSTGGMATEIGEPRESARWGLPSGGFSGGSTLSLMNTTGRRSDFTVIAQSEARQRVVSGVDGFSLARGAASAFAIGDETATGLAVESTNKAPIAVMRRVVGTDGEPALIGGAEATASAWLLPATVPPRGGRAVLVVQNPGREAAEVALRLLGGSGSLFTADRTFSVPAGRALTIDLASMAGPDPVAALVTASSGTIVVGGASYASDGAGFAATLAVPVPS